MRSYISRASGVKRSADLVRIPVEEISRTSIRSYDINSNGVINPGVSGTIRIGTQNNFAALIIKFKFGSEKGGPFGDGHRGDSGSYGIGNVGCKSGIFNKEKGQSQKKSKKD